MPKRPIRHKYHVHTSNAESFGKIKDMKNKAGKPAFKPSLLNLVNLIASFPRDKGCFMSRTSISEEMGGGISTKTIKRHEDHLHNAGIISVANVFTSARTTVAGPPATPPSDL